MLPHLAKFHSVPDPCSLCQLERLGPRGADLREEIMEGYEGRRGHCLAEGRPTAEEPCNTKNNRR